MKFQQKKLKFLHLKDSPNRPKADLADFCLTRVKRLKHFATPRNYIVGIQIGIRKSYILKILPEFIHRFGGENYTISQIYR